jgi:hypothetical protein
MMIKRLLAALLLSTTICFAQDEPAPPLQEPPPQKKNVISFPDRDYVVEVPMKTGPDGMPIRMTKRLIFIYDCSGSMNSEDLAIAISFVRGVMMQPLDEFEIGIIAFDGATYRWPGIPEPKQTPPVPKNWAALPSAPAIEQATQWLQNLNDNGNTEVIPAIDMALKEKRDELSIVIVSDGGFHAESTKDILEAIEKGQKWRKDNKLGRVNIMAVGVDDTPNNALTKIGEVGGLGYFYPAPTPEVEEPPEDFDDPGY